MTTKRAPNSWTTVPLPESDLAQLVLAFAGPLLERLGPSVSIEDARGVLALAVTFWNASVLASTRWDRPRVKRLADLRKRMRGRSAAPGDAATFDLLSARWREHALDPRLVESWSYEAHGDGRRRFACTAGLPDGVVAEVAPPLEKRISIGGRFLDEVQISLGRNISLGFPIDRHRGLVAEDGTVMVYAMMPSALQLFAEGRLPRVGGGPVEVALGARKLGPMELIEVRCGGEGLRYDIAVLVFRPASAGGSS